MPAIETSLSEGVFSDIYQRILAKYDKIRDKMSKIYSFFGKSLIFISTLYLLVLIVSCGGEGIPHELSGTIRIFRGDVAGLLVPLACALLPIGAIIAGKHEDY